MRAFLIVVSTSFIILFTSSYLMYKTGINKLYIQSEDTVPAMFLPVTIIKERTFYADSYYEYIRAKYPQPDDKNFEKNSTPFYYKKVISPANLERVHYVTAFPVITGLLAVPVFFIPVMLGITPNWNNLAVLAHITSSLIVSLSGGFLYILLKKYFNLENFKAMLLVSVYLFGSINFSLVSQSLWQHGTLELFTILCLLFLHKSFLPSKYRFISLFFSFFFLGMAILSRPTAVLFLPFLLLLVIDKFSNLKDKDYKNVKSSSLIILGRNLLAPVFTITLSLLPSALFFYWYNKIYFYSIENQGYAGQVLVGWLSRFPEGFLGLWISPSKGILIYSPVFIFSLIGLWLVIRKGAWRNNLHYVIYACIVLIYTMLMGRWKHWYGGWSFGYRMVSDILPFLMLLIVPYVKSGFFEKTRHWFYALFSISLAVQIAGLIFFDGVWHAAYDKGFRDTAWLWSVKDSEIVFYFRRVLVKFGIIRKACDVCLSG